MPPQAEIIQHSDLLNQIVIDRDTLEELGRVEVLWMYPPNHQVLGFICRSGWLGSKKFAFKLDQIHALGANGILTNSPPEPTDTKRVSQLESLLHHEVWSDGGDRIGKITDLLFNYRTGEITHYLFVSNGWTGITGELYQLPAPQVLSAGQRRVLVSEAATTQFELYREGLRQKITEVSEFLKEEAAQEWRSLARRAEGLTGETKERLTDLTEQAKEQAQKLSEVAKAKAETLNEKLDSPQSWVDQLKDKGQTVAQQFRRKTHRLSRQVEEGIETIVVQAEEIFDPTPEVPSPPAASESGSPGGKPDSKPKVQPDQAPPNSAEADDDDEPWI